MNVSAASVTDMNSKLLKEGLSDADRLEHASFDELIERLYHFLGEPEFVPHGGTIPAKDSMTSAPQSTSLIELSLGESFVIKEAYEGDFTLKNVDGDITALSNKAAFKIYVEK